MKVADITPLFIAQFERCKVKAGERAVVLAEGGSRPEYIEAAFVALRTLGAYTAVITIPSFPAGLLPGDDIHGDLLEGLDHIVKGLAGCDFIADVTLNGIIHSSVRAEVQNTGARILTIIEPPEILARAQPSAELKTRVLVAAQLLGRSKVIRVTSDSGTDVTFQRGSNPVGMQYGMADEPGRWDHWPSGMIALYPQDAITEGTIVLAPGDIIYPLGRYVHHDVVIEISKGWIKNISGAGLDADLMRSYMEAWRDPEAYATSHVGWGLDHSLQWVASLLYGPRELIGMDGRSFAGNFLWSTGPNRFVNRHTGCHLDIAMRNCTIALDEQVVLDAGRIVYDETPTGEL